MPVYNGEKYLREALDSILAQTFTDFEFIIVDDGSTDATMAILSSYNDPRLRLLKNQHNSGISASLNRGLSLARGQYLARMDCDDISHPDRFALQLRFLDENPSIDIVGSWIELIDENSRPTGEVGQYISSPLALRWITLFSPPVAHPSVMLRRRLFDHCGQYDPLEEPAEDYGLWARLSLSVRFANLQSCLLRYRVHRSSVSLSRAVRQFDKACLVSQKFISSYLGESVPLEVIQLLRAPRQASSKAAYTASIRLLHRLHRKFRRDHPLQPPDIVAINLDLANRLTRLSRSNRQFFSSRPLRLYAMTIVAWALLLDFITSRR